MHSTGRRFVFVAALLTLPLALPAQQRRDTTALSPVVVTATKVPVVSGASTAATTVIRAEDLKARGISTLADALREVPGAMVNSTSGLGSQTSLFLRGGNSNFTKVLVDGVPVNAPGGALDLSTLSVDNIDRIEVVRGPASVQYGSDAMTGVVQIFTRRSGRSVLDVRAANKNRAGDATLELARTSGVSPSGVRVTGSAGGGYHRTDGFLPFNNEYHALNASALVGVEAQNGAVTLATTYADSRFHYPTTGSGMPTDSNAYTGARRGTLSVGGNWRIARRLGARVQLGTSATRSLSDNQPDNAADTLGFYSHSKSDARRDAADAQLYAQAPFGGSLTAGVAGEVQRIKVAGRSTFGRFPLPDSRFDEARTNRAAYVQFGTAARPLSFDLGLRREHFGSGRGVTTGRAGVASEVIPRSIVRASLGTGFKEPALDELHPTSFSEGNPDLQPERNRSREIGAETRLPGEWLTLGATAFGQRFENLVQYQFRGPGVADFYNIVAARSRGWEFEARLAELQHLVLRGTYTLLRTEVTEPGDGGFGTLARGKPLVRRPHRAGSIDASWRKTRYGASAIISRIGARDDIDFSPGPATRVRLDPYTRVDLAGQLSLGGTTRDSTRVLGLALTIRVDNATNARYQNVAGYGTPGRILFLGLRADR
jgi:vitamin B12 transporter